MMIASEMIAFSIPALGFAHGLVFDITYDRWFPVNGISMPHEIHIQMPRELVDIKLRYNENGVELNIALPKEAFSQSPPSGTMAEEVDCY